MNFSRFSAFAAITGLAERKNSLQMRRFSDNFRIFTQSGSIADPCRGSPSGWDQALLPTPPRGPPPSGTTIPCRLPSSISAGGGHPIPPAVNIPAGRRNQPQFGFMQRVIPDALDQWALNRNSVAAGAVYSRSCLLRFLARRGTLLSFDIMNAELRDLAAAGCPVIQVEEPRHRGLTTPPIAATPSSSSRPCRATSAPCRTCCSSTPTSSPSNAPAMTAMAEYNPEAFQ